MKQLIFIFLLLFYFSESTVAKDCIPGRVFELIVNGNFEMGDTLFTSDYIYNPKGKNEKTYSITNNPFLSYSKFDSCGDHTTGFTNMMILNGDTVSGTIVWKQTIRNIKKGTDYEFSFWHTSINKLRAAILIVIINSDTLKPNPIFMADSSCDWERTTSLWNSGLSDTAEIKIYDAALHVAGNDFALDDLSFMEFCRIQACAGNDLNVCKDKTVQLSGSAMDGYEPYTFSWFPPIGLNNPNIQNPTSTPSQTTKYYLTVTDINGCTASDTVNVNVYDLPDNSIIADKTQPSCPCEPVTLTAKAGYDYLWSTGETTRSIIVTEPREYSAEITDKFGCITWGSFVVSHLPVSASIEIDSSYSESGKSTQVSMRLLNETNLFNCGYTKFQAQIRYNPTLLKPKGNYFGTETGNIETIPLNDDFDKNKIIELDFIAALGNDSCTALEIGAFKPECDSINVILTNGRICITDICYESGPRLIDMTKKVYLGKIIISGASLKFDFGTIEKENTNISIYDYSGKYVAQIVDSKFEPGIYETVFDSSGMTEGLYFLVMKSGKNVFSEPFIK